MFEPFCGQTGLKKTFDSSESLPIDFFCALVSDDIMDIFVRETNCYGQLKKGSDWTQTNKEVFLFFWFTIVDGVYTPSYNTRILEER